MPMVVSATLNRLAPNGTAIGQLCRRANRPHSPLATRHSPVLAAFLALSLSTPAAANDAPKYGGSLEVGTVYITLSALSFDNADWNWKHNHDTGAIYEQLFAADLSKAKRLGGKYAFYGDSWFPPEAIRGELAESWEWQDNPVRMVIKLRKGVMFPEKPGVMAARELTADDVVFSYNRINASPKAQKGYFDFVEKVEAVDKHTLAFTYKQYHSEWDYRFGYGYFSGIVPKEVADAGAARWQNMNGTGPFMMTEFVQGNSNTYSRNPKYWDKERIGGQDYQIPFVDKVVYRTIKDEATFLTALRTGKLDILEAMRWSAVDELKKSAPQLKWNRWLAMSGQFMALRTDQKPFDDIRVRRALNMAVNKVEIIKDYYGGHAEMLGYPMHPDFEGYYEPLDKMPESVQELFRYDPAKAKKLLAEAGYPNGFSFKAQVTTASVDHMELLPMVAAYLAQVGVKVEIQPMEYPAFLSTMMTKTHAAGYFQSQGHTTPMTAIRKTFVTKENWNPSMHSDPEFDKKMASAYAERDEKVRKQIMRELTREILDKAPHIWLPSGYVHTAWWPWVKNYGGELRAGAVRPGPIYARIWIDQEMKKQMGY
jgi:peptide/nickel transport system substrate-binding protein